MQRANPQIEEKIGNNNSPENKARRRSLGLHVADDDALFEGETSPWMKASLKSGMRSVVLAVLGVVAFAVTSFVSVPAIATILISAWFTGSVIYLAGLGYGIINDIIGCKRFLPYFSLGHQPGQKSLIESNDPTTNGIAWGIFATAPLAKVAAVLFTVAALITGFIGLPFAGLVLPLVALLIPATLVLAHRYSLRKEKERSKRELFFMKNIIVNHPEALNNYQQNRLKHWFKTDEDVNRWLSNSDRNVIGFIAMPIIAVAGLAAMISLSSVASMLPALCFSAALSVFPPLGLGILLSVLIVGACLYLHANQKKMVPSNPYRLDFSEQPMIADEEQNENDQAIEPTVTNSPTNSTQLVMNNLPELKQEGSVDASTSTNIESANHSPRLFSQSADNIIDIAIKLPSARVINSI